MLGPRSSRSRRKGPQGATPRTRPPAPPPLGRRPQAAWAVHCTTRRPRTLVPAPSIKRISSSNPEGPLRDGCRRPAPPSTLGLFYPDARLSRPPTASRNPVPARPAQSAARLATRSRPGLVLQATRRSAMPGGTRSSQSALTRNAERGIRKSVFTNWVHMRAMEVSRPPSDGEFPSASF